MSSFDDLGLRAELLGALGDEELDRPTAFQEAVIPALRRGGNLVARASTGAGKTLAYALPVLDRLTAAEESEDEVPLRVLVLVPTQDEAERVAFSMFPYAQAVGLTITVPGGTWGTSPTEAEIVVSPVADIAERIRVSAAKLDRVEAVVIDGAAAILGLGEWDSVDAVLDLIPRDAQRIVLSAAFPSEVADVVDRRVKRALRYPAEPALPDETPAALHGSVGYVLVAGFDKLDVLARQLSNSGNEDGPPPVIFCRNDERAAELAEHLSIRGFAVGAADDHQSDVAVAASDTTRADLLQDAEDSIGQTISFDVPADARALAERHAGDDDAVIMVEPRELPHVREVARAAGLAIRPLPLPADRGVGAAQLNAFRDQIRRAVQEEDLTAQMLVLGPLFDELGAAEVAAAASALLRRRAPALAQEATPAARPERGAPSSPASPTAGSHQAGPAPKPWTRLYVGIGSRDEVRTGDLVGALAGEADIPGSSIGKIEIRDSFSVVEVQADVADKVIRAVNGTTMKGRSVRVDYDRAGTRPKTPQRREGNRPEGKKRFVKRPERE